MENKSKKPDEKPVVVAKTPAELQKMRLDKLMKNPAKEVFIPEPSQERKPRDPLEFIRNVWGSSAGAGSGDFHVYRGVRRREYARQKYLDEKFEIDNADAAHERKMEENKKAAEERTAKKRAKRQKKKQKQKGKKPRKEEVVEDSSEEESDEEVIVKKEVHDDCDKGDNSSETDINSVKGQNVPNQTFVLPEIKKETKDIKTQMIKEES